MKDNSDQLDRRSILKRGAAALAAVGLSPAIPSAFLPASTYASSVTGKGETKMNTVKQSLKKLSLWCLGALAAVAMLHTSAHATTPQPLDIHVYISSTKDLTVDTTYYNFGALAVSSGVVASSSITVTNPSLTGIIETYTLLAGDAISDTALVNWARQNSSSSLTTDQYAIAAQFTGDGVAQAALGIMIFDGYDSVVGFLRGGFDDIFSQRFYAVGINNGDADASAFQFIGRLQGLEQGDARGDHSHFVPL